MQTKFVLAAALGALSTSVSAFIIPRDLPDGHFSFPLDGEFNTSDATALSRRQDFPDQTIGCTGGHYAHNNYDTAVQDLKIFCDSGAVVAQKHVELFRRDDTVVYICNYRDWEVPCKSDEWELKNAAMDVECGAWNGAYSFVKDYESTHGRDANGASVG